MSSYRREDLKNTLYQQGYRTGLEDAINDRLKFDVAPGRLVGTVRVGAGWAREVSGDVWADGYAHGFKAGEDKLKKKAEPAPTDTPLLEVK